MPGFRAAAPRTSGLRCGPRLQASAAWARSDPGERAQAVRWRFADRVVERGEELASIDVADNGSPIREMRKDVDLAAGWMRYHADLALQVRGETIPTGNGRLNYTLRQPSSAWWGASMPFNHPLMFATSKLAAPLVAGNTVVLKPKPEHTSLSILALVEDLPRAVSSRRCECRHRLRRRGRRRPGGSSRCAPARVHRSR